MAQTVQKNIRLTPEQWERIEQAADERGISANQLLVELAMEALDRRQWPRTEAEIHLLRSAMFTAQANRAFEILRALLGAARQWGELGAHVPDACANIAKNPRRPVARFLNRDELERLGAVLDRHQGDRPWHVAVLRLLTLTGARLSEALNLRWDEIGELSHDGASARLEDSKTGPRTVWLGPEAAKILAALPRRESDGQVFPDDLTSNRLYTFWRGVREEAGLPGLRIHDCRHTWASHGVMNGVGLPTVGRLLGHRKRRTTAIYAHLRRCRPAPRCRAGRCRHRVGDGIPGRAAAVAERASRWRGQPARTGPAPGTRSDGGPGAHRNVPVALAGRLGPDLTEPPVTGREVRWRRARNNARRGPERLASHFAMSNL